MNRPALITVLACILAVLLIATKPADQEMIDRAAANQDAPKILRIIEEKEGRVLYEVHDEIFFKTVTNNVTGHTVAYGFLNCVTKCNQ